ncbi:MAG: thioredoxin family protein [Halorientalis sp.]
MVALDSETDALERGERAPDFELPAAAGGTVSLDDFADAEALLVVFTCNHCPYAKAKIEELNHIAETYEDVAVVGINPNDAEEYPEDSLERMEALVADGTVRYDAYLRDENQSVARAYGAVCTPDPFLFERDGESFRLVYHGRIDDALDPEAEPTDHEMRDVIDRVLAGEDVDEEFRPSRGCSIKWRD